MTRNKHEFTAVLSDIDNWPAGSEPRVTFNGVPFKGDVTLALPTWIAASDLVVGCTYKVLMGLGTDIGYAIAVKAV